jgi:glycogen synthase
MGWEYPSWAHINGPAVNLLKGGILTADRVMTVSKVRTRAVDTTHE